MGDGDNYLNSGRTTLYPNLDHQEFGPKTPLDVGEYEQCLVNDDGKGQTKFDSGYEKLRHVVINTGEQAVQFLEPGKVLEDGQTDPTKGQMSDLLYSTDAFILTQKYPNGATESKTPLGTCHVGNRLFVYEKHKIFSNVMGPNDSIPFQKQAIKGLTAEQVIRIVKHLSNPSLWKLDGGTREDKFKYNLYLRNNELDTALALRSWMETDGNFSPKGCFMMSDTTKWFGPVSLVMGLADYFFMDEDQATCQSVEQLDEYIRPLRDQRYMMALQIGGIAVSSFIGAYTFVPGFRSAFNRPFKLAWRGLVKGVKMVFPFLRGVASTPMGEFAGRLSPIMANLSELAREYLKDPEAFLKKYPKGIPTLDNQWASVEDLVPSGHPLTEDVDYDDIIAIKNTLLRDKNASPFVTGPAGDGKTYLCLKFMLYAARGDLGPELQKVDFFNISKNIIDGQPKESDYSKGIYGGPERFVADLNTAMDKSAAQGRRVVLFADDGATLVDAGVQENPEPGQRKAPISFLESVLSKSAGGNAFSMLLTATTKKFAYAEGRQPDFFGPTGRGQRVDRRPKTQEQVMSILEKRAKVIGRKLKIQFGPGALQEIARASYQKLGLYNPRAAENDLEKFSREALEEGSDHLTPDMVRRFATKDSDNRFTRMMADAFSEGLDMVQVPEFERVVMDRVISGTEPSFEKWLQGDRSKILSALYTVWKDNPNIQATFKDQHGQNNAFTAFVERALGDINVKRAMDDALSRHEVIAGMQDKDTSRAAATGQPGKPNADQERDRRMMRQIGAILRTIYPDFQDPHYSDVVTHLSQILHENLKAVRAASGGGADDPVSTPWVRMLANQAMSQWAQSDPSFAGIMSRSTSQSPALTPEPVSPPAVSAAPDLAATGAAQPDMSRVEAMTRLAVYAFSTRVDGWGQVPGELQRDMIKEVLQQREVGGLFHGGRDSFRTDLTELVRLTDRVAESVSQQEKSVRLRKEEEVKKAREREAVPVFI